MFEIQLYAKDIQGSLQAVMINPDGVLLSALDASDITLDTQSVGDIAHDAVDSGNPVKIGGIARQTSPAAVADADRVNAAFDNVGRQLITPYQVRDLVSTGYATLVNSQETTIISAVAGSYLDIVSITGSNTSSVAIPVLIRNILAGNTIERIVIPAGGTITKDYVVPVPQSDTGNVITAQVNVTDQSDSPAVISIRAIQNK